MKRRAGRRQESGRQGPTERILSLPGIKEAIMVVEEHAEFYGMTEALDAAARGELGDALRELAAEDSYDALDRFFQDGLVACFVADSIDEWLETLAVKAGPKIAELWELSELAGPRLADLIYWGTNPRLYTEQSYWLPFVLAVKAKNEEQVRTMLSKRTELEEKNAVIVSPEGMQDGHIYLDVTYLPYRALLLAYKAVLHCRKQLRIRAQDLREGAPSSTDGAKALRVVALQSIKGSKEAARELGFRIYTSDNQSGSYPLFRKYAKLGHVLEQRLDALDTFLFTIEDTLRKT